MNDTISFQSTGGACGAERILDAHYRQVGIAEFDGNPLIEALPPVYDTAQWVQQLASMPAFDAAERELPAHMRRLLVPRLLGLFQPLPRHLELAQRVDAVLRRGYVGRNPRNRDWVKRLQPAYDALQSDAASNVRFGEHVPIIGFSVLGYSGAGKTTTTELILSRYPQVIRHPELGRHQVVWLKLDCPSNGSVKDVALSFIEELDRLIGTDFRRQVSSRMAVGDLMDFFKRLAGVYSLGLLVIDELQNLSVKKSGGREAMLNFVQELCNGLGVPVMLLGTMKARGILQTDFRHARRGSAFGAMIWEALPDDAEWRLLVETLWQYQWVQKAIPCSTKIASALHDETQGIVAVLIAAFILAQLRAIRTGEESVTNDLIHRVMQKDLAPMQPMLKALRSKDPRRIVKYEDITSCDIQERIEREQAKQGTVDACRTPVSVATLTLEAQAAATLVQMGYAQASVQQTIDELSASGSYKTAARMVRAAVERLAGGGAMDAADTAADPRDLRNVDAGADTAEHMREAGLIAGAAAQQS